MTSKSLSRQELRSRFQTWFDKSNEKQAARSLEYIKINDKKSKINKVKLPPTNKGLKKLKEKSKYENQLRIEERKKKMSREESLEDEESRETNLSRNLKYFNFTA
ncbi:hypothetical protein Glove_166g236 [Diversispora epigaea]|uniref:Uncharacterized protein n=1 Tax=Diversispora epigaea TaxID=1348612 RepID=A0A397IZI3_9GLOM|nr:hypothetical protein Glove_166g236 [Diversispora epigaea]